MYTITFTLIFLLLCKVLYIGTFLGLKLDLIKPAFFGTLPVFFLNYLQGRFVGQ